MAKFCTKCGKQLEEGEVCSCQAQQAQQTQQAQVQQVQVQQNQGAASNKVGVFFSRFFKVTLQIVKTPADMLKKFVQASDIEVAFGYIGVQALAVSLFIVALFSKFNSFVDSFGLFGSFLKMDSIKVSLVKIFFVTLVVAIGISFIFAAVLLLFSKVVYKGETDYKKMICVAGAKSLAAAPFTLVGFILSFANVGCGIFFLSLGAILGYYYVAAAIKGAVTLDDNKTIYTLFFTFAVMIVVMFIIFKMVMPMYLPSSINSMKDTMNFFK
jgi:H2-forming N5,N10-methylenetetrahydromethanopterin dehydrogenase-like enzyme